MMRIRPQLSSARLFCAAVAAFTAVSCSGSVASDTDPSTGPNADAGGNDVDAQKPEADAPPPWMSGTVSLQSVWFADIQNLTAGWAGLRVFGPYQAANGDVLVGGSLDGTWSLFGAPKFTTQGDDIVAARLALATGEAVWTRQFSNDAKEFGVTARGEHDSMLLHGSFSAALELGAGELLQPAPDPNLPGAQTVFLARMSDDGSTAWERIIPYTDSTLFLPQMAWNAAGGIGIAAFSPPTVDLGGGAFPSNMGALLAGRLDPSGKHLWSRQLVAEGFSVVALWHVRVAPDGSLLLSGTLQGKLTVDGTVIDSPSMQTPYVMAFEPDGQLSWARLFPSSADAQTLKIEVAGDGALIWAVGAMTLDLGSGPQGKDGVSAGHLARLDAKGNTVWSRLIGAGGMDSLVVAPSPKGGYAIGGSFRNTMDLGDGVHASAGRTDLFLAGLDAQGSTQWSVRMGDEWDQSVDELRVDGSGDLLVRSGPLKSQSPGNGSIVLSRWTVVGGE